jgi:hypothetical protein
LSPDGARLGTRTSIHNASDAVAMNSVVVKIVATTGMLSNRNVLATWTPG